MRFMKGPIRPCTGLGPNLPKILVKGSMRPVEGNTAYGREYRLEKGKMVFGREYKVGKRAIRVLAGSIRPEKEQYGFILVGDIRIRPWTRKGEHAGQLKKTRLMERNIRPEKGNTVLGREYRAGKRAIRLLVGNIRPEEQHTVLSRENTACEMKYGAVKKPQKQNRKCTSHKEQHGS